MIKLIASDLDGTLLQNGAQMPSERAIELISQLLRKGVHFAAASGRQYHNLRRLFAPVKDQISYICENGSLAITGGQVISRGEIEKPLALRILKELKKSDSFEILVSTEQCCYIENRTPAYVEFIINELQNETKIIGSLLDIPDTIIKIAVCNMTDDHRRLEAYLKSLQKLFGEEIKIVTSGNVWIDFIAPNANKGTALQALMRHLSIRPEECMAFGDQYNDVEMLQTAGVSYAMSNAAPGISYYSKYVTDSVEDVLEDLLTGLNYTGSTPL